MTKSNRRRGRKDRLKQSEQDDTFHPVWPGVMAGRLKPLLPQEVVLVEETALSLLSTLGLSQAIPSMIEKVTAAGGALTADGRLQFPEELVRWAIEGAQRGFSLCGQLPERDQKSKARVFACLQAARRLAFLTSTRMSIGIPRCRICMTRRGSLTKWTISTILVSRLLRATLKTMR